MSTRRRAARPIDIALTEGQPGQVVVHRADCPQARLLAAQGHPVATLYGCKRMPDDLPWHECLKDRPPA